MAMKKKFLGLALAGAMTLSASSAYAAGATQQITVPDGSSVTQDVDVEGIIRGNDGSLPAGRIEVVVPTSMEFTVDKNGNFIAANNYSVENKSSVPVKVEVASFTETNPNGGITVKGERDQILPSDERSVVKLSLVGNATPLDGIPLAHNGITAPEHLLTVQPNGVSGIVLDGEAGKQKLTNGNENGLTEKFNITFKISKGQ